MTPVPATTSVAVSVSGQPSDTSTAAIAAPEVVQAGTRIAGSADTPQVQSSPAPTRRDAARNELAADFVDSLRVLSSDSTAPTVARVAPEAIRTEAATLFGRPTNSAAAATYDIEVERYASRERVQFWLDYFSTRAARNFAIYLTRASRYDSMIRTRLAAAGLPQDLIFLAMIESGFNQMARSRAGAVGMWQFMPETGRRYGLTVDAWVDERRDPSLATDAAIRMLSELNDRFGSLYLAAAAYNSGPGKIQAGLARFDFGALNGDDVYFALSDRTFLRPETRDYVPKLIAAALISKDPLRFGFDLSGERWQPLRYDSLPVDFSVGLDVVARLSGTSRNAIEELNPQYVRGVTPPDREAWLRVPVGMKDSVMARLDALPPTQRITVIVHYVSRGETLSRIARQYGVSTEDLRTANHMSRSYLRVGQRLIIPTAMLRERRGSAANRATTSAQGRAVTLRRPVTSAVRRVHIVRSGENLWSISQRFGVSLDRLRAANGLSRRAVLRPGQSVRIP